MDYSKIGLFNAIKQKMRYTSERQTVLSQNIANANVPEYRAKDIKQVDFDSLVTGSSNKLQMAVTDPKHIAPSHNMGSFKVENDKTAFETTPVGNNVVLEEQALKMNENNVDHQTATSVYRRMIDLFKMAAGGSR